MKIIITISIIFLLFIHDISFKAIMAINVYPWVQIMIICACMGIVIGSFYNGIYTLLNIIIRATAKIKYRDKEKLSLLKLKMLQQRPIAVFIPAWNEAEVIDKMVDNIINKIDYTNYVIFVGTYPNDTATQNKVDSICAQTDKVVKVVTAKNGPTSKSDCLNNVYVAMENYEKENNIHFDMLILHDAEDAVNPYEFLLANYFLLTADAVQIPILPMPTKWTNLIHWTYADEFAIFQIRDSYVREKMGGIVPFAGVGMAITRRAFKLYMKEYDTLPFPEESLTEDYLLANRMKRINLKIIFLKVVLWDEKNKLKPLCKSQYFISNWSYFPMDIKRSIKQKTRWATGIVFQSYGELKWRGNLTEKENLLRDRRMGFDLMANILNYVSFIYFILLGLSESNIIHINISNVVADNYYLRYMLVLALFFMVKDMIEKLIVVSSVYGIIQGILSLPRTIISNFINTIVAINAFSTYIKLRAGKKVGWDKTEHVEGVASLPSYNKQSGSKSNDIVNITENDIADFFNSNYEERLKTIHDIGIDSMNYDLKDDNEVSEYAKADDWYKRVLATYLIQKVQNEKLKKELLLQLLFDSNNVVSFNALEIMFRQSNIYEYIKVIRKTNNKNVNYMLDKALLNRELEINKESI